MKSILFASLVWLCVGPSLEDVRADGPGPGDINDGVAAIGGVITTLKPFFTIKEYSTDRTLTFHLASPPEVRIDGKEKPYEALKVGMPVSVTQRPAKTQNYSLLIEAGSKPRIRVGY